MPAVSRPVVSGTRAPGRGEPLPAGLEADPAREQPGRQAHVEGAENVAPAQRRQEGGLGQRRGQHPGRFGHHVARLGVRGAAEHDHHALAAGACSPAPDAGRLPARRRSPMSPRGACPTRSTASSSPQSARATSRGVAGPDGQRGSGQWRERRRRRGRSRSASVAPHAPPRASGGTEPAAPRGGRRST